jgi:hypothetical protein
VTGRQPTSRSGRLLPRCAWSQWLSPARLGDKGCDGICGICRVKPYRIKRCVLVGNGHGPARPTKGTTDTTATAFWD